MYKENGRNDNLSIKKVPIVISSVTELWYLVSRPLICKVFVRTQGHI